MKPCPGQARCTAQGLPFLSPPSEHRAASGCRFLLSTVSVHPASHRHVSCPPSECQTQTPHTAVVCVCACFVRACVMQACAHMCAYVCMHECVCACVHSRANMEQELCAPHHSEACSLESAPSCRHAWPVARSMSPPEPLPGVLNLTHPTQNPLSALLSPFFLQTPPSQSQRKSTPSPSSPG